MSSTYHTQYYNTTHSYYEYNQYNLPIHSYSSSSDRSSEGLMSPAPSTTPDSHMTLSPNFYQDFQHQQTVQFSQALPSIGTLLDNNSFRISVGLRLGLDICESHVCWCVSAVDKKRRHGLKCRLNAGRRARHAEFNNIIKRALISADIPAVLEPVGLAREDGKRVDGMSLIPWTKGSMLVWDATGNDITSQTKAKALIAPIAVCTQKLSILKFRRQTVIMQSN